MTKPYKLLSLIAPILLFFGCETADSKYTVEKEPFVSASYSFAIHPYKNTQATFDAYAPILAYVESKIPALSLRLETSKDYAHFEEKLMAKSVDFALPNPYQTIIAQEFDYQVVAKMIPDEVFRGIIVARKDANLKDIRDLVGHKVSFPAPTALAATMMPKWFMYQNGLDPKKDIKPLYAGSQDSSILNAYLGNSIAGCTWPPPWELWASKNPEKASKMEVVWQTDTLPNNSVVALSSVPKEIANAVSKVLISMKNDPKGIELLKNAGFEGFGKADSSTYEPVAKFLKIYEEKLGLPSVGDGK